jgi:DNA-binding winged helix-turn-helix (wHTH) protein
MSAAGNSQGRTLSTRFGQFVIDEERRQLTKDGQPVSVSPKAFLLLQILLEQRPKVVPKQQLIERLWPDTVVEEANVRNLIAEIRRVTGAKLIRTVHRFGYAFEAPAFDVRSRRPNARLDDGTRSYPLMEGVNVIGRDDGCAVALDAHGVSHQHAQIRVAAGCAAIEDLSSKNGTWVNGSRITSPVSLREQDTIRIGVATLTYRTNAPDKRTSTVNSR